MQPWSWLELAKIENRVDLEFNRLTPDGAQLARNISRWVWLANSKQTNLSQEML